MVKELNADNYDFLSKMNASQVALNDWQNSTPELKQLLAEGSAEMNINNARKALQDYENLDPETKKLMGENSNVMNVVEAAKAKVSEFDKAKATGHILADASGVNDEVEYAKRKLAEVHDRYVTIKVRNIQENLNAANINPSHAKGTNYHIGGPALVNDQVGPLYKELITLPNGKSFIPEGRNVMLDLPKGSKVLRAALTKKLFPNYADGVGIPENSRMVQNLRSITTPSSTITNVDMSGVEAKLAQLIAIMSKFGADLKNMKLIMDEKKVGEIIAESQSDRALIKALARGEGI